MTYNDTLRSLRYTFDLSDSKMMEMFELAGAPSSRAEISAWLKQETASDYVECKAIPFSNFLNGFIIKNRGAKDGAPPVPVRRVTNNLVLKKIKIALNLKSEDIIEILKLGGQEISNHEVTAFFRKADHRNYRPCKDQVLRKFLKGLQQKYRPANETA